MKKARLALMTQPLSFLTEAECWEMLNQQTVGRLSLSTGQSLDVIPVHFMVLGGFLYFQVVSTERLSSVVVSRQVAFEVDVVEKGEIRSVLVHGQAHWHTQEAGLDARLERVRIGAASENLDWVEVIPDQVSGRILRFQK